MLIKKHICCEVCSVSYDVRFDNNEIEDTPSYCVFCGTVLNDDDQDEPEQDDE